jgi:hypothetical protein
VRFVKIKLMGVALAKGKAVPLQPFRGEGVQLVLILDFGTR